MPRLRLWFAAFMLVASLILLGWGLAAAPQESRVLLVSVKDMALAGSMVSGQAQTNPPATPALGSTVPTTTPVTAVGEDRRITLEFPARIRKGDSGIASLVLDMDTAGAATQGMPGQKDDQLGESAANVDPYETHNVIAQAELEMVGMEVRPSETVSEPLLPGESAVFRWRLYPTEGGSYEGTSWLFLDFIDKSTRVHTRTALSAQTVKIEATTLFGLGGSSARLVGGLGLILAGIVGFPHADDLLKWIRGRASAVA